VLSVGTLLLVLALNDILASLFVIAAMCGLTVFAGKIPVRIYLHFLTIPLFFILCGGIAIALQITTKQPASWSLRIGGIYLGVTKKSLWTALLVVFRSMAGVSALFMLSLSTPVNELAAVLQKLHLPELFIELLKLIYRYIFILYDVAQQMQTAAAARLGYRNFMQSCRTFAGIGGRLFLISLQKAEAYYDALLARGYDGKLEFLTEETPVQIRQIIGGCLYFICLVMIGIL
jgi:cobalt/nickel transport system permease protein